MDLRSEQQKRISEAMKRLWRGRWRRRRKGFHMGAKEAKEAGYICHQCAKDHGGVWPPGHVATMHHGECRLCGLEQFLGAWDDWDWPGDKLNDVAQETREV